MKPLKLLLFCLIITGLSASFIQQDGLLESLRKKLYEYTHENPSTSLYLHTDKNIYAAGEDIWFKAYTLSAIIADSKVLHVRLADKDRKIILSEQFPMDGLMAHGDLPLRRNLEEGDYYLYAYTDRMINFSEQDIFAQPIRIYRGSASQLHLEAQVAGTAKLKRGQDAAIEVTVREGNERLKNARGEYRLLAGEKLISEGKLIADRFGEATISFRYPQLPDEQSLKVRIKFTAGQEHAALGLNLPHDGNPVYLSVFPEGGRLIQGINSKIAVHARDINGNPLSTDIVIRSGARIISNIKTNERGIGVFYLKPAPDQDYTLQAPALESKVLYEFPKTETTGYALHLHLHLQGAGVSAALYNKGENSSALLVLRSYEHILWSKAIYVPQNDSLRVVIPADELPKDVMSLALFDLNGNLKAERLFLNKEHEDYKLDIRTDEQTYGTRKKVTLTLTATDRKGNPIAANLSVAAIEKKRMDHSTYQTILSSYRYRFLAGSQAGDFLFPETQADEVLLTKSWRSAQWPQVFSYTPKGRLSLIKNTDGVTGQAIPLRKKDAGLKEFVIYIGNKTFTVPLTNEGVFFIPSSSLLADRTDFKFAAVRKLKQDTTYRVVYRNYDLDFDQKVVSSSLYTQEAFTAFRRRGSLPEEFRLDAVNRLAEVVVKGGETTTRSEYIEIWFETCDNWVCAHGMLNCAVRYGSVDHSRTAPGSRAPEPYTVYFYKPGKYEPSKAAFYLGCGSGRDPGAIKRILVPREFPLSDYQKDSPAEPQLGSTIYWNPNITTDAAGKATFSFFTSDVKGDFIITAQGVEVSTVKPVYGTAGFRVN